ncbi:MAG TPA: hypothetical protein VE291_04170 [Terracidiphilus sp.]|nr:hypothetical protein [Terracidiphilus sp.]
MSFMATTEFLLWAVLSFMFWKKGLHRRFPALNLYLVLRLASAPALIGLLYLQAQPWGRQYFYLYFYAYWAVYLASAASLYFVCVEIFQTILSPFIGLSRLGTVVFRGVALVSIAVSILAIAYRPRGFQALPDIALGVMRSVSILELCLLGFICLCMNALHITRRDLAFGLSLGLGMMAANDLITVSLVTHYTSLTAPIQLAYEGIFLVALGVWVAYCALPESARKPVVMAPSSTIYRWNEIAAALGHGTKVAVQQPANSFFLSDVEKVVDKVLTRTNLHGSESKP